MAATTFKGQTAGFTAAKAPRAARRAVAVRAAAVPAEVRLLHGRGWRGKATTPLQPWARPPPRAGQGTMKRRREAQLCASPAAARGRAPAARQAAIAARRQGTVAARHRRLQRRAAHGISAAELRRRRPAPCGPCGPQAPGGPLRGRGPRSRRRAAWAPAAVGALLKHAAAAPAGAGHEQARHDELAAGWRDCGPHGGAGGPLRPLLCAPQVSPGGPGGGARRPGASTPRSPSADGRTGSSRRSAARRATRAAPFVAAAAGEAPCTKGRRGRGAEPGGLLALAPPTNKRRAGGGAGGEVAKDALGNDVKATTWLKTHLAGDRSLVQGLKVRRPAPINSRVPAAAGPECRERPQQPGRAVEAGGKLGRGSARAFCGAGAAEALALPASASGLGGPGAVRRLWLAAALTSGCCAPALVATPPRFAGRRHLPHCH